MTSSNKTVIEQLADFIKQAEDGIRNLWLSDDIMKVYVRMGRHIIGTGKISVTLDIASVEVEEENQGRGVWTEFLEKAHEMNPWEATYVECVHNPILATSLIRHGWMPVPLSSESFFMPKDIQKYFEQQRLKQKFFPDVIY